MVEVAFQTGVNMAGQPVYTIHRVQYTKNRFGKTLVHVNQFNKS